MQLIQLALILGVVGAFSGFSAGLFGIGGGAIIVPVLSFVFSALGIPPTVYMHAAVATSSATIIITSLRSASSHHKRGAVDWELIWPSNSLKSWGIWIGIGALLGALLLANRLSGSALSLLFGGVVSLVALQLIFGRPSWKIKDEIPSGVAVPTVGMSIGGLSALLGIGGGAFCVTLMVLCGKSIHRAIGTASAIGLFISLPATVGYIISGWGVEGRPPLSLGYVNILGFALISTVSFFTIPLGVKTAHNMDQKKLRIVFGICLLLVALNMIRETL